MSAVFYLGGQMPLLRHIKPESPAWGGDEQMKKRDFLIGALAGSMALGAFVLPSVAQEYPAKPIRIVVPYAAGGISDLVARIVGDKLTTYWGQQVIIDNRPGAGGMVGLETMVREADAGYTVLMGTSSEVTINPIFDPENATNAAARTIAIATSSPMVLIANPDAGLADWAGFIEAAKAAADPLAFSSAGNGTITHITGEAVALAAGVPLLHIAYNGGAPATMGVVSGEVPLNLATMSTALPHIQEGTVVPLAVTSAERFAGLPEVPTVGELTGDTSFDFSIFVHLTVPADTDQAIVDKLNEGVAQALAEPDVQQRLADLANTEVGLYGADAEARVERDSQRAAAVVEAAKIVLE
jgi:tripartite-type tricarboxylate transporter receptor subunit TctC